MKILRVISSVNPENGGPINGLTNSSRLLEARGHKVHVASLDNPSAAWCKSFEFPLFSFDGYLGSLRYSSQLSVWLAKNVNHYDIVIIHGLWQYHSYATYKACKKNNIPYLVFTHGMLDPWFNKVSKLKHAKKIPYWLLYESKVLNNASRVLFTSEEEKLLARKSFPCYHPCETVVSYGSPLPDVSVKHSKKLFKDNFPFIVGKRFILFISRVNPKKGIDLLIEAYSQLNNIPEDVDLVIAGPDHGGLQKGLMQNIPESLVKRIHWVGMLSGELKWGAFHSAECFILPSHQENFGIVVAEALSTSTPVLISNKVNIWREIKADYAGFIENDDLDGTKKLLSTWLGLNNDEKRVISMNSYNSYKKNFSMQSAVDSLENALIQNLRN